MHAISSYRGNRPTNTHTNPQAHKQTHTQTGPFAIHCAAKLSAQCNEKCDILGVKTYSDPSYVFSRSQSTALVLVSMLAADIVLAASLPCRSVTWRERGLKSGDERASTGCHCQAGWISVGCRPVRGRCFSGCGAPPLGGR